MISTLGFDLSAHLCWKPYIKVEWDVWYFQWYVSIRHKNINLWIFQHSNVSIFNQGMVAMPLTKTLILANWEYLMQCSTCLSSSSHLCLNRSHKGRAIPVFQKFSSSFSTAVENTLYNQEFVGSKSAGFWLFCPSVFGSVSLIEIPNWGDLSFKNVLRSKWKVMSKNAKKFCQNSFIIPVLRKQTIVA